ncbi:MAG: type I methionyl aminopeptidase [Deltaproteobacteria bacterium]|nr:type I methionyl aminopeptidase [Deltaproteobacteria bacterium]
MAPVLKTNAEIDKLRRANAVVAEVLAACGEMVRPGLTTWDLEEKARRILEKRKAKSAFLHYQPAPDMTAYPAVLCVSVNEEVVHGIPNRDRVLQDGDIVSVDFGAFKDGYCGDAARTFAVGTVSETARRLMDATEQALAEGIAMAQPGNRLQDIGYAVQRRAESDGFSVVRQFVGHGIGRAMHEDPQVPNFGRPGRGMRLRVGLVIAIEPMVNEGDWEVEILDDGWTVVTIDGKLSAHFENSIAITPDGPIVLSRF